MLGVQCAVRCLLYMMCVVCFRLSLRVRVLQLVGGVVVQHCVSRG